MQTTTFSVLTDSLCETFLKAGKFFVTEGNTVGFDMNFGVVEKKVKFVREGECRMVCCTSGAKGIP